MNWIQFPVTLRGHSVQLLPLTEEHFDELTELAADQRIWQHYAVDMSTPEKARAAFRQALAERDRGRQYPFVVILRDSWKIIGSTRFLDLTPEHRKLEIGWTWYHPDYWGTDINPECKLLLLTYCFDVLETVRVQFKTDELNERSRAAIQKIGGKPEGILRNDMIRSNGSLRQSACFSITDKDWPESRNKLAQLLKKKRKEASQQ